MHVQVDSLITDCYTLWAKLAPVRLHCVWVQLHFHKGCCGFTALQLHSNTYPWTRSCPLLQQPFFDFPTIHCTSWGWKHKTNATRQNSPQLASNNNFNGHYLFLLRPIRNYSIHPKTRFCLRSRVGEVLDFLEYSDSQCAPIKFTMGSQQYSPLPDMFLNVFSIAPHFCLICFAQHCLVEVGTFLGDWILGLVCVDWTFLYLGVYKVSELFCDDPKKEASLPQKNSELGSKTPTYDSVVTD
jgi:hypothetical protein